jgi:transcriptional regulator with XRE-family HTH domain
MARDAAVRPDLPCRGFLVLAAGGGAADCAIAELVHAGGRFEYRGPVRRFSTAHHFDPFRLRWGIFLGAYCLAQVLVGPMCEASGSVGHADRGDPQENSCQTRGQPPALTPSAGLLPVTGSTRQRLARRVRRHRQQHRWSQEVLAELSGLHRTYIGAVERAERNPSLDNVEKIATALEVSVGALCDIHPPPPPSPAVRTRVIGALWTHAARGDLEPLIEYLRDCGVRIID